MTMPNWNHIVRERLAVLRLPPEREIEIVEELALHLEAAYEDTLAAGLSEAEAEARTVQNYDWRLLECELSQAEQTPAVRAMRPPLELIERKGGTRMESLLRDLRFGVRMLVKDPGFTLIAVLTLALGIGANTAIFSVVNAVLLRPLSYPQSESLVMVWERVRLAHYQNDRNAPAPGNFADWRKGNTTFKDMTAISSRNFNLTGDGEPLRIHGAAVSASFFSVLRIDPVMGRIFTAEEDRPDAMRVVALSHRLWTSQFGGDPQILGKTIHLDGESYTVLGVMPPAFHFPDPDAQVWIPIALSPAELANHGSHKLLVVARLKDNVSLTQAQTEMSRIADTLTAQYPSTNTGVGVNLVPLHEQVVGDVRLALLVLMAASCCILLIVCANVANLLLARATGRRQELAIRFALGAGRSRVVRQLLTESVLLALVGGVLALAFAYTGVEALRTISPPDLPRVAEIGVNGPVLVFSIGISTLTGFVFGIGPALHAFRQDLHISLKESARAHSPGSRAGMRNLLVAGEIALGVIVLVGAGLLLRSFIRLGEVRLGFQPQNVLTQSVVLRGANYATASQRAIFYQRAIQRINSLPGVKSVAAVSSIPLINARNRAGFTIEGRAPVAPGQMPFAISRIVTPGYFHTMQIGLLSGRDFSWTDIPETQQVIIINRAMASAYWPNEDALGKRIKLGSLDSPAPWLTVAGIVEDVREFDPITQPSPTLYLPAPQSQGVTQDWVVRTSQDPLSLAPAVRNAIWEIDKSLPVSLVRSMEEVQSASTASHRFNVMLMSLIACLGLVLAMTGVYGVTAYSVSQRTHEISIRMALGARGRDILELVIRQGLATLLIGIAIGLAGASAATRLLKTLLFEVSATDPVTFASIPLLLAAVSLFAYWIPARRATKVDPLTSLRHD